MPRRKSNNYTQSPLVKRSALYIAKAMEKTAESIDGHLSTGNDPMADKMAAYAHGLKDALSLIELAAQELARKPSA